MNTNANVLALDDRALLAVNGGLTGTEIGAIAGGALGALAVGASAVAAVTAATTIGLPVVLGTAIVEGSAPLAAEPSPAASMAQPSAGSPRTPRAPGTTSRAGSDPLAVLRPTCRTHP